MSAPVWLLTLAGGALADRSNRRRFITVFQSIQMLCPTAIVIFDDSWDHPPVDDHPAFRRSRRYRCALDTVVSIDRTVDPHA